MLTIEILKAETAALKGLGFSLIWWDALKGRGFSLIQWQALKGLGFSPAVGS